MKKLAAFCAVAIYVGLAFFAIPASAQQSRMKACNNEWTKMKADGMVGNKKYADFRRECLSRAAAPVTPTRAATRAVIFPSAVSSKYSNESAGRARMHTCVDQYNANKASNGNGDLRWIQKGGGYFSQCNARLKTG